MRREWHPSNYVPYAVLTLGLAGLAVWVGGYAQDVARYLPGASIKPATAINFCIAAVMLRAVRRGNSELMVTVLSLSLLVISCLLATMSSALPVIPTGGGSLAQYNVTSKMPSLGSLVGFCLTGCWGLTHLFNGQLHRLRKVLAALTTTVGLTALAGYAMGIPALWYWIPGVSNGMAIVSAVNFILIGVESYRLGRVLPYGLGSAEGCTVTRINDLGDL